MLNLEKEIQDVVLTVQGIHLMSYANQIVEGFLDKIQDVGLIATQNLLMNNAHSIVKIIKQIQDAKISARTILVILSAKEWSCLGNQGQLIQVLLPQRQQKDLHSARRHQEQDGKNQYQLRQKELKSIMIITTGITTIITEDLPVTMRFIVFIMILVMAEETGMEKRGLAEALILMTNKFIKQKIRREVRAW